MRRSTKAGYAWDSGSVNVPALETLMPAQAGTQYPGSTWRKFLPHKLKKTSCSRCNEKSRKKIFSRHIRKSKSSGVGLKYSIA